MKSILCLIFIGLVYKISAVPSCNFQFDGDNKYFCPLTDGNIDAGYDGVIDGKHWDNKTDSDVQILTADEVVKEFILKKIFSRFKNLEILEFRKGSLSAITQEFFYNCDKLKKILIKESVFDNVPASTFGNCTALIEIDLGSNNIKTLDTKAFTGLVNLEILRLSENEMSTLQQSTLSPLQMLKTLDLSKNSFKRFDANVFSSNKELSVLFLAENTLEILVAEYFSALKALTTLDLTKNMVNETAKGMVDNLVGLSIVKFKDNACINKDYQNFKDSDVDDFKTCIENHNGGTTIKILSSLVLALSLVSKFL